MSLEVLLKYQYPYLLITITNIYILTYLLLNQKKKKFLYLFHDWKMSILLSPFFYHKFTTHFQFLLNHISSYNSTIKILRNYFITFILFFIYKKRKEKKKERKYFVPFSMLVFRFGSLIYYYIIRQQS